MADLWVLNKLSQIFHEISTKSGWWIDITDPYIIPAKIALIHSEISEAMEGFRKNSMDEHLPDRKSVEVELADALIRIFDLAGALGLDLDGAIWAKSDYNQTRIDHKLSERNKPGGKRF